MSACEMCGAETGLVDAVVEGSLLRVCRRCSTYGSVVTPQRHVSVEQNQKKVVKEEVLYYIVSDYSARVKEAREKRGWKQEELASFVRERESVIHKIENGHMKPSLTLAAKLEKTLGITLVERYEEPRERPLNLKDNTLTIGDLVKLKGKGQAL